MTRRTDDSEARIRPDEMSDRLTTLLGAAGPSIAEAFRLMGVAEEALATVPKERQDFMALMPPKGMAALHRSVYRAHALELTARMRSGQSLDRVTDAEALMALHAGSLCAPLDRGHAVTFERLFERIVGPLPGGRAAGRGEVAR